MPNKNPTVSVLMTVYNAEQFVEAAIASIQSQTYSNWEMIVVDDGSTDNSLEIVRRMASGDKRMRLVALKHNVGPSHASNAGIKLVRGKYLARMDADDISLPTRLARQVAFLEANPEVVMVGGQCELIDEDGEKIGRKSFPLRHHEIYSSLFIMNPIQHPTCMIRLDLVPRRMVEYHNGSMLAHDLELVFDLARYGKLANLEYPTLKYRQYMQSLSLRNPKETFLATLEVRNKAMQKYGYVPGKWQFAMHQVQRIIVKILPPRAIYPFFMSMRQYAERLSEVMSL